MTVNALDEILCSRIEYAENLVNHGEHSKKDVEEFEQLLLQIEQLMKENNLHRQFLQFDIYY